MLLELVQYLVGLCSEGVNNPVITKEACQCLGLIGIRDFGAVSLLSHKHIGEKIVVLKSEHMFYNATVYVCT